jgi:hypothetical protein
MTVAEIVRLFRNKRAVSAVISNLVLIGAVIAVGLAALVWTNSASSSYMTRYGVSVQSNINQLSERITFEYIFYNRTAPVSLTVYLINCGSVGTVTLTKGYIRNASWTSSSFGISLHFLNESSGPNRALGVGQEGWFINATNIAILQSGSYTVNIVTGRGSSFAGTFAA